MFFNRKFKNKKDAINFINTKKLKLRILKTQRNLFYQNWVKRYTKNSTRIIQLNNGVFILRNCPKKLPVDFQLDTIVTLTM